MATFIDKLASKYLANGGQYSEDEIREACQKIQANVSKWYNSSNSLFDFGSDFSSMSEDKFMEMMQSATSSSGDLDQYFSVLYDVMNTDGVDGLSREEIDTLFGTSGKDSISSFSIYHHMSISSTLNAESEDGTVPDGDDGTPAAGTDTEPVDGDDDGDVEQPVKTDTTSKPDDFSDMSNWSKVADYIKAFLIEGNDEMDQPSEIIDYLLKKGKLSQEEAEYAKQALIYGSQDADMQRSIKQWIENGDTFDEAIEKLGIDINETDLYKTAKELKNAASGKETKDVNIDACVEQLYNSMHMVGTNEDSLENLLFDENISDEDFVQIVKKFEEKYGLYGDWGNGQKKGLVTRIEKETSGDLQSKLTTQLAQRLLNAAEAGNEDAIDLLCSEIYSGTVGQNCTANDFLDTVFADSVSNSVISKINERYNDIVAGIPNGKSNSKGSLYEDIRTEYNGIFALGTLFGGAYGSGSKLLSRLEQATRYNN